MHPRFLLRGSASPAAAEESETVVLPVLDPRSGAGKREVRAAREAEKRVHLVPLVVLVSLLVLWWFCYPVTLEMVEGRIVGIYRLSPSRLNDTLTLS